MTEFRVKGDAISGLKGFTKEIGVRARITAASAMARKEVDKYEVAVRFGRKLTKQVCEASIIISGANKEMAIGKLAYKPTVEYCKEFGEMYEKRK